VGTKIQIEKKEKNSMHGHTCRKYLDKTIQKACGEVICSVSTHSYFFDSLPCSYLGMPLGSNPKRLSTWKPIIENFRRKLSMWRGRMLSMAGRICLIKSVFSSLTVYYMSSFLMPKGVCNILTSIQRRFLWSGVAKQKKICKVQ